MQMYSGVPQYIAKTLGKTPTEMEMSVMVWNMSVHVYMHYV